MLALFAGKRTAKRRAVSRLAFASVLMLVSAVAEARPYRLAWDANTDGVTTGYVVFYGTAPGAYQPANGVDVGNTTEFQVDLTPGSTYFFVVRAYTEEALQGPPSAEFQFAVPVEPGIVVSPTSATPGQTLTVAVSNGPGHRYDWVGLYPVGNSVGGYLAVKYLNNSTAPPGSGSTNANLTFAAPTQAGQYNVRFNSASGTTLATSTTITVAGNSTVTPSASSYAAGATVSATVANSPGMSRYDWVGLYPVSNGVSGYVREKYLNNLNSPPASPQTAGTVTFNSAGLPPGSYNVRLVAAGGSVLATSTTFTITSAASITATGTVSAGGTVTAVVSSSPGSSRYDWVGFYPVNNSVGGYIYIKYLNDSLTPPATPATNGTVNFTIGSNVPPGNYNARLISAAGSTLATSGTITVTTQATVTVSGSTLSAGASVTATITNSPGSSRYDWVGFYPVANSISGYVYYKYLNNQISAPAAPMTNGSVTFATASNLPAGQYNIRLISAHGTQLAVSQTVTVSSGASVNVSSTTVNRGGTISATVVNGPGTRWDWVGLYPVNNGNTGYVDWRYLNGAQSAPATGMTTAAVNLAVPMVPGQYNVRFFYTYGSTPIAISTTITVQ